MHEVHTILTVQITILLNGNYIQQTMRYNHYSIHDLFYKIMVSLMQV
jgi:hypothetical protein